MRNKKILRVAKYFWLVEYVFNFILLQLTNISEDSWSMDN